MYPNQMILQILMTNICLLSRRFLHPSPRWVKTIISTYLFSTCSQYGFVSHHLHINIVLSCLGTVLVNQSLIFLIPEINVRSLMYSTLLNLDTKTQQTLAAENSVSWQKFTWERTCCSATNTESWYISKLILQVQISEESSVPSCVHIHTHHQHSKHS